MRWLSIGSWWTVFCSWIVAMTCVYPCLWQPAVAHDLGAEMSAAAQNLQAALTDAQRAQMTFPLDDPERRNWHFIPKDNRRGVPFRDMTPAQQQLAYVLLNSALSHHGFGEAMTIMSLEQILHDLENKNTVRDPEKYYVSIFGTPSQQGLWGWRVEGHHLSVNFLLDGGKVIASTPSFFGSNPARVQQGPRQNLTALEREETLALALVRSLDGTQRAQAVLELSVPNDIILGPGRAAEALDPKGIAFRQLNPDQQQHLQQLIRVYVFRLREPLAQEQWKRIEETGWDHIHFAWVGSLEPRQPHYYRVQGPTFLLEYDNTQNNANHVHSVWRDMSNDFGEDVLRRHYSHAHSPSDRGNSSTAQNQLNEAERRSGWQLLFDGRSLYGWRNYRSSEIAAGWSVQDGALTRTAAGAGDIVTTNQFGNFELSLEYNIDPEADSGILFHVTEQADAPWRSGPEVQIHDGPSGTTAERTGWLSQLYKPFSPDWSRKGREAQGLDTSQLTDPTRPPGQWNQVYLRVSEQKCEVAVNGISLFYFQLGDEEWNKRLAASRFAQISGFAKAAAGHLCLRDAGGRVAFRNIKVRPLQPDGTVRQQPIDGILPLRSVSAFPHLTWEGWQNDAEETGKIKSLRVIDLVATRQGAAQPKIFVATQDGRIYRFENSDQPQQAKLYLDLRDKVLDYTDANECGLMGLALHPRFMDNGEFFVHYFSGQEMATIVSRFRRSADNPNVADPQSERILLKIPQPFQNHNGGGIEFGPDGYLYVSVGDGGDRNDPLAQGQRLDSWLGKILRIDVNRDQDGRPYGIPTENPFVSQPATRPEIYAYGLRNTWRFAFDRITGTLWGADVGQDLWEEINLIQLGGNYGWSHFEGTHLFGKERTTRELIAPIWEYDHQIGKSITGGRVYRSNRLPELYGLYLYADFVSGKIWALDYDPQSRSVRRNLQLVGGGTPVLAFGEDDSGEVYYLTESNRGDCIFRFER